MKRYITKLTDEQKNILNASIEYEEHRRKCFSILSYVIKHVNKNNGFFNKSYENFYKMYIRYHDKMSLANFKLIISKLADLNLIFIVKYKKRNVYFLDKQLAEQMAKEINAGTLTLTTIGSTNQLTEILNHIIINNTNTNNNNSDNDNSDTTTPQTNIINNAGANIKEQAKEFFKYLKESYKGIAGNVILTKSELKKIAKNIFSYRGVHEAYIQNLVFSKINYSNQRIQAAGAINYIDTIITEKLVQTSQYVLV